MIDFTRNPIRDPLCPYRYFGIHIDPGLDLTSCFRAFVSDTMCFHAILLLASASNDLILNRPLSRTSCGHLHQTLPLLNQRLSHPNAPYDDAIVYAIGVLASVNMLFGHHEAALAHSKGLSHIFKIREGGSSRQTMSSMRFSIDRYVHVTMSYVESKTN